MKNQSHILTGRFTHFLAAASLLALLITPHAEAVTPAGKVPAPNSTSSLDANRPGFPSLAPVLQTVMPAVVSITVQGELPPEMPSDEEDNKSPPNNLNLQKPRKFASFGSGVIMDAHHGYVVTNTHVIRNANTIYVTLIDGRRERAKIIGVDGASDIAVLQIKVERLSSLPIADSNDLRVGDFVVAIGNPFSLNRYGSSHTATYGIVSALQRNSLNIEGVENFIQTDAAINPGNSGGALVNVKGELVGINTAIISTEGGGNIGIGFAIPSNMAKSIMDQIVKYGSIRRGLMGVFVQHLSPELAVAFGLSPDKTDGALVTQVNPGSPAEKAGLRPGDVIQEINNNRITEALQVKTIISLIRVGERVTIKVLREGKPMILSTRVADIREDEEKKLSANPYLYGLALRDFEQESPVHGFVKGVQVVGANETSNGWRAGLRPGDVVIAANQIAVHNIKELHEVVLKTKEKLLIQVLRGPGALYFVVNEDGTILR